jgi:hypothetical protein
VKSEKWHLRLLVHHLPVQPVREAGAIIVHHVMNVNVTEDMIDMHLDTSKLFLKLAWLITLILDAVIGGEIVIALDRRAAEDTDNWIRMCGSSLGQVMVSIMFCLQRGLGEAEQRIG